MTKEVSKIEGKYGDRSIGSYDVVGDEHGSATLALQIFFVLFSIDEAILNILRQRIKLRQNICTFSSRQIVVC